MIWDGPKTAGFPGVWISIPPDNNPFGSREVWNGENRLFLPYQRTDRWNLTAIGITRHRPIRSTKDFTRSGSNTGTEIFRQDTILNALMRKPRSPGIDTIWK